MYFNVFSFIIFLIINVISVFFILEFFSKSERTFNHGVDNLMDDFMNSCFLKITTLIETSGDVSKAKIYISNFSYDFLTNGYTNSTFERIDFQ